MNNSIRIKLSSMMFLQYFVWGAWYVTLSTYLGKNLNFEGPQIGLIYGTVAIGAMVSPVFIGMVADRFFASQKILGVLHLIGGILLLAVSQITNFGWFYAVILIYTITYMPTIALTNALSFKQMADPGKEFPTIRVLGTIGWIIAGTIIGFMQIEAQAIPLQLAGAVAIILGLYSFTLPHTPPEKKGSEAASLKELLGLDALKLMKNFSFAVLVISSLLVCIPLSFYYNFTNLFLNDLGMDKAAFKMTFGQGSEIFFMLVMPFFFRKLGVKKLILIAIVAWIARYLFFAFGDIGVSSWMLYAGILLHGICYDFFFVTGQIYVDKRANKDIRSAAQGLITFATYGVGMFIGAWVSGQVVGQYSQTINDTITYQWDKIWIIPVVASVIVLFLFGFFFRDSVKKESTEKALATS